ncbi:hypothetical protein CEP52_017479 [Fusarium oligoseptatum]|uniref:DUF521 domain protein n=1 Tax=Fusarium oligoseptatum TaxID=2604345 RepID=A0A428RQJ3_9HYPO|nr:hypothetical protein CEP52_017479 [Fusarium oligoseptatum]
MRSLDHEVIKGTAFVLGKASGKLIASGVELSFWGGVNVETSEIVDHHHPLNGYRLHNSVLAIPGGRGSCSGSGAMLELILKGNGPRGIIFQQREDILTLGVMIAEEVFQKSIPVVVLNAADFHKILTLHGHDIHIQDGRISGMELPSLQLSPRLGDGMADVAGPGDMIGLGAMRLSAIDMDFLNGVHGEAARVAMRIVLRMAVILGAEELMDITQVHVDACIYTGPAALALAERLRDWGGKVRVPTTLNAISVDQKRWRALGVETTFGLASEKLGKAYTDMGAQPTFTCAPYQLNTAPKLGDQVAWAESNAVIYANSVLGARTMKNPDFLDISIALTGRAPKAGPHLSSNRLASLCVRVSNLGAVDDSFPPLLGYYVGLLSRNRIPVVTGLETLDLSNDDLKAFGAAFATVCSAPMFHIVGITPEAVALDAVVALGFESVDVNLREMAQYWDKLNTASLLENPNVDLISLGNPHFSFAEMRRLANLCRGRVKAASVAVIITCGRAVYGLAKQAGLIDDLELFGVKVLTDICWCMVTDPIISPSAKTIMTNSGKYAHYGPGLTGRGIYFGSLAACVEAACCGVYDGGKPQWLLNCLSS